MSRILELISLSSVVYFRSDFCGSWGMEMPDSPYASFHMVLRGQCRLRLPDDSQDYPLSSGDVVLLPFGNSHQLYEGNSSVRVAGSEVLTRMGTEDQLFTEGPVATTLVCGHFEFDRSVNHTLLRSLPNLIHLTGVDQSRIAEWNSLIQMIIEETRGGLPGSGLVVSRLAESLFVQILRSHYLSSTERSGFLAALYDSRISQALDLIHDHFDEEWTIGNIALRVGMSRASFSERFHRLVGETPMQYLTAWRMLIARRILRSTNDSLIHVAETVGYASEAAFSRALKRLYGANPTQVRKEAAL